MKERDWRITVLGCLALVLAACTGGGAADPVSPTAPGSPTSTASPRATPAPTQTGPAETGTATPFLDPANDPDHPDFEPLEPAETVVSADGNAEIRIPADALPDTIASADLTITTIDAEEVISTPDGSDSIVAYRLEPSGTYFLRPLTIAISLPIDAEAVEGGALTMPLMMLIAGDAAAENPVEAVSNTRLELDAEAGTMTVLGEALHFSDLAVDRDGLFVVRASPSRLDVALEQSFTWTVTVTTQVSRRYTNRFVSPGPDRTETFLDVDASVADGSTIHINRFRSSHPETMASVVVPDRAADLPAGSVPVGTPYTHSERFTCWTEGTDGVFVRGGLQIDYVQQMTYTVRGATAPRRVEQSPKRTTAFAPESSIQCLPPFQRLGPPYVIICPDGTVLTGTQAADPETGEPLTDEAGNPIDSETGEPVTCPD